MVGVAPSVGDEQEGCQSRGRSSNRGSGTPGSGFICTSPVIPKALPISLLQVIHRSGMFPHIFDILSECHSSGRVPVLVFENITPTGSHTLNARCSEMGRLYSSCYHLPCPRAAGKAEGINGDSHLYCAREDQTPHGTAQGLSGLTDSFCAQVALLRPCLYGPTSTVLPLWSPKCGRYCPTLGNHTRDLEKSC